MKRNLKITLIELPATVNGKLYENVSDDVYSFVRLPSRATDLLKAIAIKAGYNDVEAINPRYNKAEGKLTHEQLTRIVTSDVVGISVITRTASQSFVLADYVKRMNPNAKVLLGGPHVSALPEEAIEHADVIIANEGDHTFIDVLNHLSDSADLSAVAGIIYKNKNGEVVRTSKRAFLTNEELTALPFPIYSKEVLDGVSHLVINTSRGCPYACEYCAVIENFGREYRFMDVDRTVELIEHTLAQGRKKIFFGDDNFTAVPKRSKELLEKILSKGIKMPPWLAQVRVESANDPELLKLMKRAGCERVCIGFESVNEATLKAFNKHSTLEKNTIAIKRFHENGISLHGMFIVGAETDTKETIKETAEYAKRMKIDTVQFTYIVPLPGTKMTLRYEKEKRVISHEWHLYDGHHPLLKLDNMPAHELIDATNSAWLSFYSIKEAVRHLFYGNEHWFNFLVRIWGNKLIRKVINEGSYYQRALSALDNWYSDAVNEYDNWVEKVSALKNDAKVSLDERQKQARIALENAIQKLSAKRDQLDEFFAPYKEKVLHELEMMMRQRLNELALNPV